MKTISLIILAVLITLYLGSAIWAANAMHGMFKEAGFTKIKTTTRNPIKTVQSPPEEMIEAKWEQNSNPGQIIASREPRNCDYSNHEGAAFDRGNGNCGFAYYNACPYSEAVSADDPMCYKTNSQ